MTDREIIGVGILIGVVGFYLYARTESGAVAVSETAGSIGDSVGKVASAVRGIRNNNPGNIRKSGEAWQGLAPTQTDTAFFQFVSMPYGVRAMVKILRNYSTRHGLNTVQGIINRWAPPNENNTGAYVAAVADAVGVSASDYLNLDDANTMFNLVRAIVKHENGAVPALLVTDSAIWQGIELA